MSVEPITKPQRGKPANDAPPHVIRAINEVTAALAGEGISKSRANQQQGYKFRGIDEVLNALARLLADHKLVIVPHVRSREMLERTTKDGKGALFNVVIVADYTFVSADDGSQHEVGPFYGEAMDSADKATNKAMSAAYKYMAIQTFCIPTEGDNDADATTHEVAPSAGGERASPASPPRQQPSIRAAAQPFIDKAKEELATAAGSFDAVMSAFDDIKAKPGWKQLNSTEQEAIQAAKREALPDDPR